MRVLICGGTGFLGKHIVNALIQLGHDPVVAQPPCVVSPDAIIARCVLGQGKVVLVADADWLGAPQWRGPSGSGPAHISSGNIEWLIAQVDGLAGHVPTRPAIFRPVWTH